MSWVRLLLAGDFMQAEAIKARLYSEGIEARVIDQTNTGSTAGEPAIRLGGISAVSSGHPILVPEQDLEQAQKVVESFIREINISSVDESETSEDRSKTEVSSDARRFVLLGVVGGLLVPPLMVPFALYWLIRYLKRGGNPFKPYIILGIVYLVVASYFYSDVLREVFEGLF